MGNFAAVPILIGSNGNEGSVFELGQGQLDQYLNASFGNVAPEIIPQIKDAYPVPPLNGYETISFIQTLAVFQCGSAYLANATTAQDVPVWRYYYNATFRESTPSTPCLVNMNINKSCDTKNGQKLTHHQQISAPSAAS